MLQHRRLIPLVALLPMAAALAADDGVVLAVPQPDRVVIQYRGLPVSLGLAHIEVPPGDQAGALQQRLGTMLQGKHVDVVYARGFGSDASGSARVQLVVDFVNINEAVVAAGLARYKPGDRPEPLYEERIQKAQEKAQKAKVGVWAGGAVAPAAPSVARVEAKPVETAPVRIESSVKPKGPFCSELDSAYYHPSDSRQIANVNPQRLIYYPDEAAAKRAGKTPPARQTEDLSSDGSEKSADGIFARGKEIYAQAISLGNTPERDAGYEKAYGVLTKAMQLYSALLEARPNDERLGEKLRQCMQLRYGSVKQRRFEH
jgi:hypothetical protein